MNLDKLLKKVELNYEKKDIQEIKELKIANEVYEVKTFTRSERERFAYTRPANNDNAEKIIKWAIPYIYRALNLKDLALRAKEKGYIKSYYDIVNMLFEPFEVMEIIGFLAEINSEAGEKINEEEEYNEIKK